MKARDQIDNATKTANAALTRLFQPLVDAAKTEREARAVRTILVAVLANKLAALLRGAPNDDGKGSRASLRALVDDVLNERLN
jgi:hypothetical protein